MGTTFYHQLQQLLDDGMSVAAVATIVQVKGSTPRKVGTKMIVHPYGKHIGTVGGGCGEANVIRAGLDVLVDGSPRTVRIDLTEPNPDGEPGGLWRHSRRPDRTLVP
jgi:xanthine dehydrogenase accessory factor